ncbi:unnamed protein product [Amoebophrya sp. A120]|nr:unnamed protein product [Amoebophrya sp. A120]|eukprot:GSA120T00000998001.1
MPAASSIMRLTTDGSHHHAAANSVGAVTSFLEDGTFSGTNKANNPGTFQEVFGNWSGRDRASVLLSSDRVGTSGGKLVLRTKHQKGAVPSSPSSSASWTAFFDHTYSGTRDKRRSWAWMKTITRSNQATNENDINHDVDLDRGPNQASTWMNNNDRRTSFVSRQQALAVGPKKLEHLTKQFEAISRKALLATEQAQRDADALVAAAGRRAGFWTKLDKLFTHMNVPKDHRFSKPVGSENVVANRCDPLQTKANASDTGQELLSSTRETASDLLTHLTEMET